MNSGSQESSTSTPVASQQLEPMDTQATLVNTQSQQMDSQPNTQLTQSAEAIARDKEREMAELLITMDNYKAIIPDAVIDYYLNKTGFDCDDARIKKLFALAAQKFIADIATDAFQHNKVRQSSIKATTSKSSSKANKDKKVVLNMDDLSSALAEYGVNIKKPDYYS